jgi:DNA-binding MarR family transcriptional regulator
MKIEQEIHQKSFKSEYQKLVINILFTHSWVMSHQKKLFEDRDITTTQYNILRILRGQQQEPVSINILKERMLDKMSDTSRLVERLRVKGLVERKVCKDDRRKSEVRITDRGIKLLGELDYLDDQYEDIFSSVNEKEARRLNSLLDKLRG